MEVSVGKVNDQIIFFFRIYYRDCFHRQNSNPASIPHLSSALGIKWCSSQAPAGKDPSLWFNLSVLDYPGFDSLSL